MTRHARVAIEQMLRIVVPGFVGQPGRQVIREPFADWVPGFSTYLRHERGLRDTTLDLYDEHLRVFAAYLGVLGRPDLQELSPAAVSGFPDGAETGPLPRHGARSLRGSRVFLRYLHRERLIARDLSLIVEAAPCYRLAPPVSV